MLRKSFIFVCVFVTLLATPIVARGFDMPIAKDNSYDYQYIAPSNYRHFINPKSISTTVGRVIPDLVVADEIGNQTQITRFDDVDKIGQYESKTQILTTLDYLVDDVVIAQSSSYTYLISLSGTTLKISNLSSDGEVGSTRAYENVYGFEAYPDYIYMLQKNTIDVYSLVKVLFSNFGISQIRVPDIDGTLTQLLVANDDKATKLEELEYYTVQQTNTYSIRKVTSQQLDEKTYATDSFAIAHLRLQNNTLFYSVPHRLTTVNVNSSKIDQLLIEQILSAQLVGNKAYFIIKDKNGNTSLQSININQLNSSTPQVLLESTSDKPNFFSSPNAVTSRNGVVYVADTDNSRVAIISDKNTDYLPLNTNVQSVAISRFEYMYTVVNTSTGSVIYKYQLSNNELIQTIDFDQKLSGLAIDLLDNVYTYSGSQLYYIQSSELKLLYDFGQTIYSISTAPDQAGIYALYGSQNGYLVSKVIINDIDIYSVSLDNKRPTSITVDFNNNIFALYNGGTLIKYSSSGEKSDGLVVPIASSDSDTDMSVSMANITTTTGQTINVGDILITHKTSNALISVNNEWAGVEIPDWNNYQNPDYTSNKPYTPAQKQMIMTLTNTATLYDYPTEMMASGVTLDAGTRVILIDYKPNGNTVYSFVMLNQVKSGTFNSPQVGYVLSDLLTVSESDKYTPPITSVASVIGSPKLYRYPTTLSVPLIDIAFEIPTGTQVVSLDFADYKSGGFAWSRIQYRHGLDNQTYIGFVQNQYLTMSDKFNPNVKEKPRPNATINAENVSAVIPFGTGNNITTQTIDLPSGTRVRVKGKFNPNSRMTEIEFYDSKLNGVFTADVPTSSLTYDNITSTQVITFIICLFIIAAIIIGFLFYKNIKPKAMLTQMELDAFQQQMITVDNNSFNDEFSR